METNNLEWHSIMLLSFLCIFLVYYTSILSRPCKKLHSYFSQPSSKIRYISQDKINELYQLLNYTQCLLTKLNMPYIMIGGTLLGAVRSKGLIPWDYDADIVILDDNITFIDLRDKLMPLYAYGIITYINDLNGIVKVKFKDSATILDVFVMRKVFDTEYNKFLYRFTPPYDKKYKNEYFAEEELYPLVDYKFGPLTLKGPTDAISYLNRAYPNWQSQPNTLSNELTYFITQNIKYSESDITLPSLPNINIDTTCN